MAKTDDINANALERRLKAYEVKIANQYREALVKIRADIGVLYEKYAVNGQLTYGEMTKFNRLTKLERRITDYMAPTIAKNDALLAKISLVEYDEAFYRYGWSIDQQLGASLQWGQLNPEAVKAAVANPLNLIARERLRFAGRTQVRNAVTQGLIQGLSYDNMVKGIKGAINGTAYDAMRIARTEGQRAQVLGQQANYEEAEKLGVEFDEIWDATLDSKTRPAHGALDGVAAQVRSDGSRYWDTSVGEVSGPLQSGYASFDIHCRCRVRAQIKDFEPKSRRVGKEIVSYETYDQWKERTGR